MANVQRKEYLESKIRTASAPQLHLMLIEGAIRFCRRADTDLEANNEGSANEALLRGLDIVSEMLAGVRHSEDDLNVKLSELYKYLFYTLTSAYVNADRTKLADVLRILEFERETWQQAVLKANEVIKGTPAPHVAPLLNCTDATLAGGGLSLEV